MAPKESKPAFETIDLSEFKEDSANARLHDPRNRKAIRDSLERFGAARSIVVDGQGVVRAGNGTFREARESGIDRAIVVDATGDQLVVVRRKDWTPTEATAYAITDNRSGDLSKWDYEVLGETIKALQQEDYDISVLGWEDHELEPILAADWTPPDQVDLPDNGDDDEGTEGQPDESVKLTAEQRRVLEVAIARVRDIEKDGTIPEGRCVEIIAEFYVGQAG